MAIRRGRRRPVTPVMDLWLCAVKADFRMQVDANAVSCAATSHHAVSISPHAVTQAALSDFTLGSVCGTSSCSPAPFVAPQA